MTRLEKLEQKIKELERKLCCKVQFFDTYADFPTEGSTGVLYIDEETGNIYIWDGVAYVTADAAADHGSLTGLGDDDHSQYTLLAGRATGQTINGGIAANEDITINGTSHATKTTSYVILQQTGGSVGIGTATPQNKFQVQNSGETFLQATTTNSAFKAGFFFNYNNLSYAGMKLYYNPPDANVYFDNLYQADAINNFGDTVFRTTPDIIGTQETSMTLKGSGGLLSKKLVEANTAGSGSPNIIIKTESGTVFTNEGATALNYHTLPTAAAGLTYTFYVDAVDGIRVVANAGDIIQINGIASSVAGYCESLTIGSSVTLTAINTTDWVATSVVGTWNLA